MAKRDVWVRVGRKMVTADTIKNVDFSARYVQVKATGEREPLNIRPGSLLSGGGYSAEYGEEYAATVEPEVIARGLLDAIASCAADGRHWLLTFEDNTTHTAATWVRTELGRDGLTPTRADREALPDLIPHGPPPAHWATPGEPHSK